MFGLVKAQLILISIARIKRFTKLVFFLPVVVCYTKDRILRIFLEYQSSELLYKKGKCYDALSLKYNFAEF